MPTQLELLASARFTGIMQGIYDPRLLPQQPVWVGKRVPIVPATDEELMMRYIGTPVIADIIADDAKANVYQIGKFQPETNKLPNLKFGIPINQSMINMIDRLTNNYAQPDDMGLFTNWQGMTSAQCKSGVLMRMEVLTVAMLLDNLNYDRMGVKINKMTWGTPSDLKGTVGTDWSNTAATPVNDMWGYRLIGKRRYNIELDRATMSTPAFQYMIQTTEFQNKARQYLAPNVSFTNLELSNLDQQRTLAQNVTGFTIELDDRQVWHQNTSGVTSSFTILPINNVILTSTANDGNAMAYDFGNAVVSESLLGGIAPSVIGNIPLRSRGPVAFTTLADAALNPPGAIVWGVGRGFPRKKMLQASAALTVGTFTDSISTALPF